jgi:hypothetical protein
MRPIWFWRLEHGHAGSRNFAVHARARIALVSARLLSGEVPACSERPVWRKERVMATHAEGGSILLMKKFGGVALILFGLLLTATGYSGSYPGLTTVGVLLLIGGMVLLALKIARRNQANTL